MSRLISRPLQKSMPRRLILLGMGQKGRHITSCTPTTTHMAPMMNTCIIGQVK